jgi:hypothetical protein
MTTNQPNGTDDLGDSIHQLAEEARRRNRLAAQQIEDDAKKVDQQVKNLRARRDADLRDAEIVRRAIIQDHDKQSRRFGEMSEEFKSILGMSEPDQPDEKDLRSEAPSEPRTADRVRVDSSDEEVNACSRCRQEREIRQELDELEAEDPSPDRDDRIVELKSELRRVESKPHTAVDDTECQPTVSRRQAVPVEPAPERPSNRLAIVAILAAVFVGVVVLLLLDILMPHAAGSGGWATNSALHWLFAFLAAASTGLLVWTQSDL